MYIFWFLMATSVAEIGPTTITTQEECKETRCKPHGPAIRFPFRLRGSQPNHCGYPGFDLSCSQSKQTILELPNSVNLSVKHINYEGQQIHVYDSDGCLARKLPNLNLSATGFKFSVEEYSLNNWTVFNCSSDYVHYISKYYRIPCLSNQGHVVQYSDSGDDPLRSPLLTCSRIFDVFKTPGEFLHYKKQVFRLDWFRPNCSVCEVQRLGCHSQTNSTGDVKCFSIPRQPKGFSRHSRDVIVTGVVLCSFLVMLVVITGLYLVYRSKKQEKESAVKIEKFLEDYKALKPTRYVYADIKRITDNFKEKLGQGGYGTVFKGRLSNDILVAVKVLNNFKGDGEEFINEVGSMGRVHHINVARLGGFCADGYKRALVYEYLPNESLEKYIVSAKGGRRCLSWEKLEDIAVGIAKGIEYLHHGCEQRILHFDIKPHNILLDENFNPKISDFGLAKLCTKDQSVVSMMTARGTVGYIAPEVLSRNFGNVSYKSDVYSFGMLLLEMIKGRKDIEIAVEDRSQVNFPGWLYSHLDEREEQGISTEGESFNIIAKKLAIVGLCCIQWHPVDRPSMNVVVQMLQGVGNNLNVPPNPFISTDGMNPMATGGLPNQGLQIIPESE
ncbi:hypothetical protein Tsubulata_020951 [Turnera subulata]|uniref:Protein kinase domain-containing protein n=1 Tax=Turnera subulata TaxID=218843 RepID=A0A9Q0F251_9ROSI|nr:hypothetical protein Tsubulata_020951 [Turnera subulata]